MGGYFELEVKKSSLPSLKDETLKSDFWDNKERATTTLKEISNIEKIINQYEDIEIKLMLLEENFDETDFNLLKKDIVELEINTLFVHEYDAYDCYVEIHPGAGGTESCDWAYLLFEMYKSFCEKNDYKFEIVNYSKAEEAGIKNALVKISGYNAYGYLKLESGVHRLVRISPFDSNKRRHTSFASVSITPEFNNNIDINIKDEDIKIDVYRSSGAGGQSVNTTDSAVRVTHLPTKTVVTCQNERSQLKNKEVAIKVLKSKLYELEIKKQEELENSMKSSATINFGSQIRSYILEPYKLVKDHRSNFESFEPDKILSGNLKNMLEFNLSSEW